MGTAKEFIGRQAVDGVRGEITIATTGDCILTRPLSPFKEKRFLALIDLLRQADVAFTNLELTIPAEDLILSLLRKQL